MPYPIAKIESKPLYVASGGFGGFGGLKSLIDGASCPVPEPKPRECDTSTVPVDNLWTTLFFRLGWLGSVGSVRFAFLLRVRSVRNPRIGTETLFSGFRFVSPVSVQRPRIWDRDPPISEKRRRTPPISGDQRTSAENGRESHLLGDSGVTLRGRNVTLVSV